MSQTYEIKPKKASFITFFSLRFPKIRHYGILSNTSKAKTIPVLQEQLGKVSLPEKPRAKYLVCPVCKTGELITIMTFKGGRDPPSKKRDNSK